MRKTASAIVAGMIVLAPVTTAPAASASTVSAAPTAVVAASGNTAQAIRMAKSYLRYSAFSRTGLIDQLKYEGFTTRQSTRAVASIRVSWKKQAVKTAKSYLRYSAFSRTGLIDQLKYEGFTTRQAKHGVRKAGL